MLQREIGNAKTTPVGALPKRGDRIREFSLSSLDGRSVSLSDYRGRSNLVLLFLGELRTSEPWANAILEQVHEFEARNAYLLAVATQSRILRSERARQAKGCQFLLDADGSVHRAMGASSQEHNCPALYITDRFGEIVTLWRTSEGQQVPDVSEMLSWLDYIENVCPECEPPEWPLD